MITRRHFMALTTASLCAPKFALASPAIQLRAEPVKLDLVPNRRPTSLLGFNGSTPGPTIRTKQGESLNIKFENRLSEGSSIHWHGIRLNNAMDGVPMLTQDFVYPEKDFDYSFVPPDAGTYWYHSHYISYDQVGRGLMGALVVEEQEPPDVDLDITAILADWQLDRDGSLSNNIGNMHDTAHAGQIGNFAKAFLPDVQVRKGQRIRLRLINGAIDRIFSLQIEGLSGKIVALDGMPLNEPKDINSPVLAPAQRMDIIADVTSDIEINLVNRGWIKRGLFQLGKLKIQGEQMSRTSIISPLPQNPLAAVKTPSQELELTMMGGAMGGRHGGSDIWAFNNISEMQPVPFASFTRGETARIRLNNDTAFPHGIHLHGHHFYEVDENGKLGDIRDTTLVMPRQSRDIVCNFDNRGRWLLHCHMLSHQASGMKTWVEVL